MDEKNMTPEKKPSVSRSFKTRAFKAGSYSFLITVIVVIIAVVLNVLVSAIPSRFTKYDLTANDYFTLSDQTEQLLKNLDEKVELYWMVQTGKENTYIEELLHRYADLSDEVKLEKIDYVIFPSFAEQYTDETVSDNSVIVVCGDNCRYIDYEQIFVTDASAMGTVGFQTLDFEGEKAVTSAIMAVTSGEALVVYELSGHGEKTLKSYSETLAATIGRENYVLSSINLTKNESVPADCACLMLISPASDLSEQDVDKLIAYLQKGGQMIILCDPLEIETPNLDKFLAYYGVEFIDGIIVENDTDYYNALGQLYLLPKMTTHVITNTLQAEGYTVMLPGAQGIGFLDDVRQGVYYGKFLNTSESSYSKLAGYDMKTTVYEDGDIMGPFTVGCTVTETVDGNTCHLCIYTSTYLLNDNANQMVSGANFDLMVNTINWSCNRVDDISIRSKSMNVVPLKFPSGAIQNRLIALMVVGIPIIPLIIALAVTVRRRRR